MVIISRIESTLLYFTKSYYRQSFQAMSNFAGVYSTVYINVPSSVQGSILSRSLIEEKLAACVNIVNNVKAVNVRNNVIYDEEEDLLMAKTRTDTVDTIIKYVKEHHPNAKCQIISVPIQNGNEDYLKFIDEVVPPIDQRDK